MSSEIDGIAPEAFGRLIKTGIVAWTRVVNEANIRVE
jgi:hypothetical protein